MVVATRDLAAGTAADLPDTPEDLAALADLLVAAILVVRAVSPVPAAAWAFRIGILVFPTTSLIDHSFTMVFAAVASGTADFVIVGFRHLDSATIASAGAAVEVGDGGIHGGDRLTTIRGGGGIRTISDSMRTITGNTRSRMR